MAITVRGYTAQDVPAMAEIWNQVVEDGEAFPQLETLGSEEAAAFFAQQNHCAVAVDESGNVIGLYILHPNNIGRCGHIGNASYAVKRGCRGLGVGEALVRNCLSMGRECGFSVLQFNAVVAANHAARHLYEKLGFVPLGTIPGGFLMKDGHYEDICLYYHLL